MKFFKSSQEFSKWLHLHHKKENQLWVCFFKKGAGQGGLAYTEALEIAMTYGWTSMVSKKIDYMTFKALFYQRKPKSVWSLLNLKKFRKLQREGRIQPAGLKAYQTRDKSKSEEKIPSFDSDTLKRFKSNKKAWSFFEAQTPSYRKYMTAWVMSAKRQETKDRRILELINDSAEGSKLKRVVEAQNKIKSKTYYQPGATPIEEAKNIGFVTAAELRSLGIETVEQLKRLGWESVFQKLCELYPNRLNKNMLFALIGAIEDQKWNQLDPDMKAEASALMGQIKRR